MITLLAAALVQSAECCTNGVVNPWTGYNQVVTWEPTLGHAQARARKQNKLIVLFRMVGDLDLEGC